MEPGRSVTFTFFGQHESQAHWRPVVNEANTSTMAFTVNLSANQMEANGQSVPILHQTRTLNEDPNDTVLSDGTVLTNGDASWNSPGTTQVYSGDKLRITGGVGVTPGDYRILIVDSDTQLMLQESPESAGRA